MDDEHDRLIERNRAEWAARPWWRRVDWLVGVAVVTAIAYWALQLAPLVGLFR